MIARIIPGIYDTEGKLTGKPVSTKHKRLFHGTFPMGRYVSQPLSNQVKDIKELRSFLKCCKYVSDREQFNRKDYWMPPEEFEKKHKGDCDDFALWTWRQMLGMGYGARYVVGISGKYGEGHAWVTLKKDGVHFLVEPLAHSIGNKLPRLSIVTYQPTGSVGWDGKNLQYFIHEKYPFKLKFSQIPYLVTEWIILWIWFWFRFLCKLVLLPFFLLRKLLRKIFRKETDKN